MPAEDERPQRTALVLAVRRRLAMANPSMPPDELEARASHVADKKFVGLTGEGALYIDPGSSK